MSLAAMLAVHDDNALSALATVGLLRRATRDFEAGKATVQARDDTSATVNADGQVVTVRADNLAAANCGCPATGICRHIILAVLALRALPTDATADPSSAQDDILALVEDDIRKFAGADWDKALNLARISLSATISQDGANVTVELPDIDAPVTFLAGQGAAGAVFKGPKTIKRRVVSAALIVARQQLGAQALDKLTTNEADAQSLSTSTLRDIQATIEDLVIGVFTGGSIISEDRLFDLSISTRAQTAPRLTALLRILVHHARQARAHHFDYDDDRFLADASLTYALTVALASRPNDTQLTGVLQRSYSPDHNIDLEILGAAKWHTASGARGLRIYGYAPDRRAWYTTAQARGAGMDPSFTPENAYDLPLWGAGTVRSLGGQKLHLRHCKVSEDNQIAWDYGMASIDGARHDLITSLEQSGALFNTWRAARRDIAQRAGSGLGRTGISLPLLLEPADLVTGGFDDLRQHHVVSLIDRQGTTLSVDIPPGRYDDVEWLIAQKSSIAAILCEVKVAGLELSISPVSVMTSNSSANRFTLRNLTLDEAPTADDLKRGLGGRALSFLKTTLNASPAPTPVLKARALEVLCNGILDAVAVVLRFRNRAQIPDLEKKADRLNQPLLKQGLRYLDDDPGAVSALRVAYLASETMRHHMLLDQ